MHDASKFPSVLIEAVRASLPVGFSFLSGVEEVEDCDPHEPPTDGMMSVIGFVGDFTWSFTLVMPRHTVEAVCLAFTGFDFPYESAETGDIMGELANVLAGEVSAQMSSRGVEGKMSLPTVARGNDIEFILREGQPSVRMQFRCCQGQFGFKLVMARSTEQWARRPVIAAAAS